MRFTSVAIISLMLASTQAVELTQHSSLALGGAPVHHKKHAGQHKHHKKAHRAADHKNKNVAHAAVVAAPKQAVEKQMPNADDIGAAGDSKAATVTADTEAVNAGADAADSADAANAADQGAIEKPAPEAVKAPAVVAAPAAKLTVKPKPATPKVEVVITKKADAAKPKAVVKNEAPAQPKKIKAIAHSKAKVVDVKKPNFAKKGHEV